MKEIPLTKGKVAIVDDEDYERVLSVGAWYARFKVKNGIQCSFYAVHCSYKNGVKNIHMSRFIMNTPDNLVCDHINGNRLDNRKSNLRNCTSSENEMNKKVQKNNKLGVKNITTRRGYFYVKIRKNKIVVYSEKFTSLETAVKERDIQLKIHHGEFVREK